MIWRRSWRMENPLRRIAESAARQGSVVARSAVERASWSARFIENVEQTSPGAKARNHFATLHGAEAPLFHGAEAPLFHGAACAALPRCCMRRSSTVLHAPLFHGAA